MNLRTLLSLALLCACALGARAQTDDGLRADSLAPELPTDSLAFQPMSMPTPWLDLGAPGLDGLAPWSYGLGGPTWRLHQGFNAQLSLSLTAALGRGAPGGVGFGQSAAFAYAMPLSQRLSVAAGIFAANMDWGALHHTDVGLAAIARYRLTDRFSLYAYGAKRLVPTDTRPRGYFPFFLPTPKDRLGAMAEFKIGQNAMVQVSVERNSY